MQKLLSLLFVAALLASCTTGASGQAASQLDTAAAIVKEGFTQIPITGLGVIKPGQSPAAIAGVLGTTIKQCKNDGQFFKGVENVRPRQVQLFRIQPSVTHNILYPLVDTAGIACGYTFYALVNYEAAGIRLPGIVLTFYKNSLISIDCKDILKVFDVLNDALSAKYGRPVSDIEALHGDKGDMLSWEDAKSIIMLYQRFSKDDKGEPLPVSELVVADKEWYGNLGAIEAKKMWSDITEQ